jgi:hypothetical protein
MDSKIDGRQIKLDFEMCDEIASGRATFESVSMRLAEGARATARIGDVAVLGIAARTGNLGAAQALLASSGKTELDEALYCAAQAGQEAMVVWLLPLCDPKSNAYGEGALAAAAGNGHARIVRLLLPLCDARANESKALRNAAFWGRFDAAKALLSASDPAARDSEALRSAAMGGHARLVRLLLPRSDAKARGSEALRAACRARCEKVAASLWPAYQDEGAPLYFEAIAAMGMDAGPYMAVWEASKLNEAAGPETSKRGRSSRI